MPKKKRESRTQRPIHGIQATEKMSTQMAEKQEMKKYVTENSRH